MVLGKALSLIVLIPYCWMLQLNDGILYELTLSPFESVVLSSNRTSQQYLEILKRDNGITVLIDCLDKNTNIYKSFSIGDRSKFILNSSCYARLINLLGRSIKLKIISRKYQRLHNSLENEKSEESFDWVAFTVFMAVFIGVTITISCLMVLASYRQEGEANTTTSNLQLYKVKVVSPKKFNQYRHPAPLSVHSEGNLTTSIYLVRFPGENQDLCFGICHERN